MKKAISTLLGTVLVAASLLGSACASNQPEDSTPQPEPPVEVFDGWTPQNILEKEVTKDDVLFGTWVTFADTGKKWSALDQIERYYYMGLNFMPFAATIPSAGMISEEEKAYLSRDLTSMLWWQKIDSVMKDYNMVYFFSTLAGLANDRENCVRRDSMLSDEALADARDIIPQLDNCIGVHVFDEPTADRFPEMAKWARRYAAITDADGNSLGLEALVNMFALPYENYSPWMSQAGSSVGLLAHDFYPFATTWTDYGTLFTCLNTEREVANEYGVKMGIFPQACDFNGRRMPNFEEIKWHVNMSLAYGATEFYYFNLMSYPAEGCTDAVLVTDGSVSHPEIVEPLSLFHREVRALDANIRLNSLDVTEVYATPNSVLFGVEQMPNHWLIEKDGLDNADFLMSLFEPDENSTETVQYLNIVNSSFEHKVEGQEFTVGEGVSGLEVYNWETGKFERIQLINGTFEVSFDVSESKFFKIIQ